jgi:hypothetical protein
MGAMNSAEAAELVRLGVILEADVLNPETTTGAQVAMEDYLREAGATEVAALVCVGKVVKLMRDGYPGLPLSGDLPAQIYTLINLAVYHALPSATEEVIATVTQQVASSGIVTRGLEALGRKFKAEHPYLFAKAKARRDRIRGGQNGPQELRH